MKANKKKLLMVLARKCMNLSDLQKISEMPMPTIKNVVYEKNVKPATLGKVAKALDVDVLDIIDNAD